jgi:hypothetical protein
MTWSLSRELLSLPQRKTFRGSQTMNAKRYSFPVLALLTSGSTLICCVLPVLFVSLGFGSVLAGFIGVFPQITWASENKEIVFGVAAIMITLSGLWEWKRRNDPCPLDPELAKSCTKLRKISFYLWLSSALILAISSVVVFVLPMFLII